MHETLPSQIMNDEGHEDDDHYEHPNIHNESNGENDVDDANEDHVYCLSSMFPNTDNNPAEYVFTRDSTDGSQRC
jgi:hypothetical protein